MNSGEVPARGVGPVRSREVTSAWLSEVRARLAGLARRRVAADAVEDVVQDALRVIVERGLDSPGALADAGEPGLAWCFRVLRNVIGNHYQKERVQARRRDGGERAEAAHHPDPSPLESLASADSVRLVESCLAGMESTDPACARYLRRLGQGFSPRELAGEERLDEAVLYRRVYRCRIKLRALLEAKGYFA
jgi:DNA-directed RNA polymerase specialized sigma24 family protein